MLKKKERSAVDGGMSHVIFVSFLPSVQAKAFELSYLEKVPEVKDTVHKQSLLHHVCTIVVEKFPDSTDLYSEIGAITRSAKVCLGAQANLSFFMTCRIFISFFEALRWFKWKSQSLLSYRFPLFFLTSTVMLRKMPLVLCNCFGMFRKFWNFLPGIFSPLHFSVKRFSHQGLNKRVSWSLKLRHRFIELV